MLGHDKCPPLRNLAVLPLLLSPERDEQLLRLTEHRVPMFSHDLVPDYLRTKPVPEAEQKMLQLEHKATTMSVETIQVIYSALLIRFQSSLWYNHIGFNILDFCESIR